MWTLALPETGHNVKQAKVGATHHEPADKLKLACPLQLKIWSSDIASTTLLFKHITSVNSLIFEAASNFAFLISS